MSLNQANVGLRSSITIVKGAIQKICHAFSTKFDPLPPFCHKLSHMSLNQAIINLANLATPYHKYVTGHNTLPPTVCILLTSAIITKPAKSYSSTHK